MIPVQFSKFLGDFSRFLGNFFDKVYMDFWSKHAPRDCHTATNLEIFFAFYKKLEDITV